MGGGLCGSLAAHWACAVAAQGGIAAAAALAQAAAVGAALLLADICSCPFPTLPVVLCLQRMGIQAVMLSGDQPATAHAMAEAVGIDAHVSPVPCKICARVAGCHHHKTCLGCSCFG